MAAAAAASAGGKKKGAEPEKRVILGRPGNNVAMGIVGMVRARARPAAAAVRLSVLCRVRCVCEQPNVGKVRSSHAPCARARRLQRAVHAVHHLQRAGLHERARRELPLLVRLSPAARVRAGSRAERVCACAAPSTPTWPSEQTCVLRPGPSSNLFRVLCPRPVLPCRAQGSRA